jgi:hypothetical protein
LFQHVSCTILHLPHVVASSCGGGPGGPSFMPLVVVGHCPSLSPPCPIHFLGLFLVILVVADTPLIIFVPGHCRCHSCHCHCCCCAAATGVLLVLLLGPWCWHWPHLIVKYKYPQYNEIYVSGENKSNKEKLIWRPKQ